MNMLGNFALQQTDNYQCFKLLLSRRYCTLERVFSINEALISVHSYKRAMHFIALESNQRMVPYIIFHHRLTPQKTTELLKKPKHKMFAVPFDIQDDCPIK
jgi:hypothetical protein